MTKNNSRWSTSKFTAAGSLRVNVRFLNKSFEIYRTSTQLLTVNSDYLSDRLLKIAKMDNSYSESSVQQTTEPAMFFPPLPTKPLPTPTEMDNWLSDLDAKNDEQTSSVPSVGSGDIELSGFNPEVVSITDLIVQRKPTRPLRNDVYVKLPRKIARTRISRVVNDQLPAAESGRWKKHRLLRSQS